MREIWKDIPNYKGLYQVSNLGCIKSLERIVKRPQHGAYSVSDRIRSSSVRNGYLQIILSANGKKTSYSIHRLVAELFIPNPDNKPCVNHKNGIRNDNSVENLEWCSYSENMKHCYNVLGRKKVFAGKPGKRKQHSNQKDKK